MERIENLRCTSWWFEWSGEKLARECGDGGLLDFLFIGHIWPYHEMWMVVRKRPRPSNLFYPILRREVPCTFSHANKVVMVGVINLKRRSLFSCFSWFFRFIWLVFLVSLAWCLQIQLYPFINLVRCLLLRMSAECWIVSQVLNKMLYIICEKKFTFHFKFQTKEPLFLRCSDSFVFLFTFFYQKLFKAMLIFQPFVYVSPIISKLAVHLNVLLTFFFK